MNLVDKAIDTVDAIARGVSGLFMAPPAAELIDLETVDDDSTLICRGGTFCSVIELLGCNSTSGDLEYGQRIAALSDLIGSRLRNAGEHTVKVVFESDPTMVADDLQQRLLGARMQAKSMKMDISDIIDEKIEVNSKFCQRERAWLVLYTHKTALGHSELARAEDRAKVESVEVGNPGKGQKIYGHVESLRDVHKSALAGLQAGMANADMRSRVINTDEVLRGAIYALQGPETAKRWQPDTLATGKDQARRDQLLELNKSRRCEMVNRDGGRYLTAVNEENVETIEPFLPRRIGQQIVTDNIFHADGFLVARDRIYAPVEVVRHAAVPADFDNLVRSMRGSPFRVVFTLTPNGLAAGNTLATTLASALSWVSRDNRRIDIARKKMAAYRFPVVGFSIVAVTWAQANRKLNEHTKTAIYDTSVVEGRLSKLQAAINDWGGCQSEASVADPLEAVLSSIPGMVRSHISTITPAPVVDAIAMLPISRLRTVWDAGAALYRTPDGTPMSYEQMSGEQAAWVTLCMGPMGFGKSSQMNSLNLAFLAQSAASNKLPYLRGIDFGYSASGVVDIVQSSLPSDQRHRARYVRMKNKAEFAVNVFDTPRGARFPLPNHTDFLTRFLYTLAYSMRSYPSLDGLCAMCVKLVYQKYSDDNHNRNAKPYRAGICRDVDDLIAKRGLGNDIDSETSWWGVVDKLFDAGETHAAGLAQRYAVPTLEDIQSIASSELVRKEYSEFHNGIAVTDLFSRTIREAIDAAPILRDVTQFDISDSEVLILDLADVVPSASSLDEGSMVRAAATYMLAMRVLSADFFIDETYAKYFPPRYRAYHEDRISNLATIKKRFFIDEKQRIKGITSAEGQADQMIVEGRKFGVDVMQGSQIFDDFSPKTQNLATTIIICGAGSQEAVLQIKDHYGLNETERDVLASIKPPIPGYGSTALFIFKTKSAGKQSVCLVNTEGPKMLCALATEAEDRRVRSGLYSIAPSTRDARNAFAMYFPGGSVKAEVARRKDLMSEGLYKSQSNDLLQDLVIDAWARYEDFQRHQNSA